MPGGKGDGRLTGGGYEGAEKRATYAVHLYRCGLCEAEMQPAIGRIDACVGEADVGCGLSDLLELPPYRRRGIDRLRALRYGEHHVGNGDFSKDGFADDWQDLHACVQMLQVLAFVEREFGLSRTSIKQLAGLLLIRRLRRATCQEISKRDSTRLRRSLGICRGVGGSSRKSLGICRGVGGSSRKPLGICCGIGGSSRQSLGIIGMQGNDVAILLRGWRGGIKKAPGSTTCVKSGASLQCKLCETIL